MASETTLDRFGRVVIPKRTRERFGLEPGSRLEVADTEGGILLTSVPSEPPLRRKGKVLVFSGDLVGDADRTLARQRDERIRRLGGRSKA